MRLPAILRVAFPVIGVVALLEARPPASMSQGIAGTCNLVQADHYFKKGFAFLGQSSWSAASAAFYAAAASQANCPRKRMNPAWGYFLDVGIACADYNLQNYEGALNNLAAADKFEASAWSQPTSAQGKVWLRWAKTITDKLRVAIAAAASRPSTVRVQVPAYQAPITAYSRAMYGSNQQGGSVIATRSGCDYFIVATSRGYDLLEWFGGWPPDRDDELVGTFEQYGFHSIYDRTASQSIRVWVEDYWLDEDDAYEKLNEHC